MYVYSCSKMLFEGLQRQRLVGHKEKKGKVFYPKETHRRSAIHPITLPRDLPFGVKAACTLNKVSKRVFKNVPLITW